MNKKTVVTPLDNLLPLIKESFSNNQKVSFKVKGTSMSPFFQDGITEVTLKKFDGELKKNGVYLYRLDGTLLLHRYIKTKQNKHFFRGDALYNEEIVSINDVIGEVVSYVSGKETVDCTSKRNQRRVRYYLTKKAIRMAIRRIVKGR